MASRFSLPSRVRPLAEEPLKACSLISRCLTRPKSRTKESPKRRYLTGADRSWYDGR
jgi:hypothetical protein